MFPFVAISVKKKNKNKKNVELVPRPKTFYGMSSEPVMKKHTGRIAEY